MSPRHFLPGHTRDIAMLRTISKIVGPDGQTICVCIDGIAFVDGGILATKSSHAAIVRYVTGLYPGSHAEWFTAPGRLGNAIFQATKDENSVA